VIEVNLLPGKGKRKASRRGVSAPRLPAIPGLPRDRWALTAGALCLLSLGLIAFLFFRVAGEAEELDVAIEAAQRDSIRFAEVIARSERLLAQRDSIAQRVAVLQEIDETRYIWAHIMDEVGRAVPDFTWITRLQQVVSGTHPTFQLEGRSANYFGLTSFMESLEASPFLRDVRLIQVDAVLLTVSPGVQRRIYSFLLEARYQDPPPGIVDRVPLFGPSVAIPGANGWDTRGDVGEQVSGAPAGGPSGPAASGPAASAPAAAQEDH
jgi:Tfp pilus assembly protein PilN